MDETFKELAARWVNCRPEIKKWLDLNPEIKKWLDLNREQFCDALGLWTGDDELLVILMRLADPDGWPDADHWKEWKDDLGRARDKVIRPFIDGKEVDQNELRIGVRMLVAQLNQACEKIYYMKMKRDLGRPRRHADT